MKRLKTDSPRTPKKARKHADIGKRLLWSRLAIQGDGELQQDYATRARIHRTLYSEWEKGTRRITLEGALKLCKTYNLSLDWIYRDRIGTIDDDHLKRAIADVRLAHDPDD
jgi:transcriptional regulator with XRE-family HTH domain